MNSQKWMNAKGFTLLELLIAMSIAAVAAVTALTLFSKGIDIWQTARFKSPAKYNAVLFLEDVDKELKNSINFSEIEFEGETRQINFPAIVKQYKDEYTQVLEIVGWVKYSFDKDKKSIYKSKSAYPQCLDENLFTAVKVLDSVESISFEYAFLNAENKLEWTSACEGASAGGNPKAVRIKVKVIIEESTNENENFEKTIFIPIA
ncbi:MAG: prepilin-type N-terminal cleavage/methylation domain-containing protein [Candidatus Omnitrophota bacterium]